MLHDSMETLGYASVGALNPRRVKRLRVVIEGSLSWVHLILAIFTV
jgi:hypothetical protein